MKFYTHPKVPLSIDLCCLPDHSNSTLSCSGTSRLRRTKTIVLPVTELERKF